MFAAFFAHFALVAAGQASPPMPTVVNLCNETPATVAFMVARPTGRGLHTQRGWFNVAPGECLAGGIGDGRGGEALVHARSGSFSWPSQSAIQHCVSEGGMDRMARSAPCAEPERAAPVREVRVEDRRSSYLIEHTVRCRDLPADEAVMCEAGQRERDGFAALVRTLEVCNTGPTPLRALGAGEAGAPGSVALSRWAALEPESCAPVWRGQTRARVAYVRVESAGESPWADDDARFCVPESGEPEGRRVADSAACGPGERLLAFRAVNFGPGVSKFTADYSINWTR
ncbi:MAG: DUF1036 domain-containing protein [Oceanicaulis sp.]